MLMHSMFNMFSLRFLFVLQFGYVIVVQALLNNPDEWTRRRFHPTCIRECGDDVPFSILVSSVTTVVEFHREADEIQCIFAPK